MKKEKLRESDNTKEIWKKKIYGRVFLEKYKRRRKKKDLWAFAS